MTADLGTAALAASANFMRVSETLPVFYANCACGCGQAITTRDSRNRPRRYVHGHQSRGKRADLATYGGYHDRVRAERGTPSKCEECGIVDPSKRYEWASISGNYADPADYRRLCKTCHMRYDNVGRRVGDKKLGVVRPDMQGERHWLSKLTAENVIEIRKRLADGETTSALAFKFRVTADHVSAIGKRKVWRHL